MARTEASYKVDTPLNNLRVSRGMTVPEVAAAVGTSKGNVYAWFAGQFNPPSEYCRKLATLFEVSEDEILSMLAYRDPDARKIPHSPYTFKDNFWSNLRVLKKYTLKNISDTLGHPTVPISTLGMYFSGSAMPDDRTIKRLCDMFGVDFLKGQCAFAEAHRRYKVQHTRDLVATDKQPPKKRAQPVFNYTPEPVSTPTTELEPIVEATPIVKVTPTVETKPSINITDICSIIYGHIPYSEYVKVIDILNSDKDNAKILNIIYGKVDFETYIKLTKILG